MLALQNVHFRSYSMKPFTVENISYRRLRVKDVQVQTTIYISHVNHACTCILSIYNAHMCMGVYVCVHVYTSSFIGDCRKNVLRYIIEYSDKNVKMKRERTSIYINMIIICIFVSLSHTYFRVLAFLPHRWLHSFIEVPISISISLSFYITSFFLYVRVCIIFCHVRIIVYGNIVGTAYTSCIYTYMLYAICINIYIAWLCIECAVRVS